jgi:hypothetical protein
MSAKLINISDPDQKLYRVFPLLRALDLFENQQNAVVRPKLWDDPYENLFLKAKVFDGPDEIDITEIQRSWYGQCWTTIPESDAMWRIYSPSKDGVRVSTTVRKLAASFFDVHDRSASLSYFLGKVDYAPSDEITSRFGAMKLSDAFFGGQNDKTAVTLLLKRDEFAHEHEVRLLYCDVEKKHLADDFVSMPFDANNVVDDIMFDPRLDIRIVAALSDIFSAQGFTKDVSRSKLYESPQIVVSL